MIILEIVFFLLLLLMSAFFSGAEAAFFSIKKSSLVQDNTADSILKMLSEPRKLLITILTGNTIINVIIASFAAIITVDVASRLGANIPIILTVETIILSLVIILVSEITPKILAIRNSELFAKRVSTPIRLISFILYPIAALLYNLTHLLTKFIPKKEELFDSEAELITLAEVGVEKGSLNHDEMEMIQSVFDFGETAVREIMVPRTDIISFELEDSLDEVIKTIQEYRFSKFPVYEETLDKIKGILYAKDVLPFLNGRPFEGDILSICRETYFVPESKRIDDLLKDFQQRRENIAIVVDEYGGTAGMVTVEDIVEEVVGEIRDEFDRETPLIVPTKKGKWIVDAKISINDLEDKLPIPFPEDREYDSLGGFLLEQFGEIPDVGAEITYFTFRFRIRKVIGNRIIKVIITKEENRRE